MNLNCFEIHIQSYTNLYTRPNQQNKMFLLCKMHYWLCMNALFRTANNSVPFPWWESKAQFCKNWVSFVGGAHGDGCTHWSWEDLLKQIPHQILHQIQHRNQWQIQHQIHHEQIHHYLIVYNTKSIAIPYNTKSAYLLHSKYVCLYEYTNYILYSISFTHTIHWYWNQCSI